MYFVVGDDFPANIFDDEFKKCLMLSRHLKSKTEHIL